MRAKTGVPVSLDAKQVADPLRPVTVRTGDLPPWQAVEAFCQAAGLREVFPADLAPPSPTPSSMARRTRLYSNPLTAAPTAAAVPVTLADGASPTLPGERGTAVRVLALPPNFAANRIILGSGEVTLNLDVAPVRGREWGDVVGVRVRRALDDAGRPVPASHRLDPGAGSSPLEEGGFIMVNGRVAMWNSDGNGVPVPASYPNPRVVPLTLRTGDRGVRRLRLLEGTVQAEVVIPDQTLLTVDNVLKAVGSTVDGPNFVKLTVAAVREEKSQVTIKLRLESPSPWFLQQMKARRGLAANAWGGALWLDAPQLPVTPPQFQVIGADGKALTTASNTYSAGNTDDGSRMYTELGLTFRGGSPARLVMTGPRTVTVDVPFRLENVPLP